MRVSDDSLDSQNDRVIQSGLTVRPNVRVLLAHQYSEPPWVA
jgi:hypothetical protein